LIKWAKNTRHNFNENSVGKPVGYLLIIVHRNAAL
jgi:hypothetical protein